MVNLPDVDLEKRLMSELNMLVVTWTRSAAHRRAVSGAGWALLLRQPNLKARRKRYEGADAWI